MKHFLVAAVVPALQRPWPLQFINAEESVARPHKWVTREDAAKTLGISYLTIYSPIIKFSYPENSTVNLGVSLLTAEFDKAHDIMKSDVWLRFDKHASNIAVLRVPPNLVWKPDVVLYNGPNKGLDCTETNVLIYYTGTVLWVPPCRIESYCNVTLWKEPYVDQECMLKFGSWTFDGFTMGLDFWQNVNKTDIEQFVSSRKFKVTKNNAVREEEKYDCCVEPYYSLQFNLGFTKKIEGKIEENRICETIR